MPRKRVRSGTDQTRDLRDRRRERQPAGAVITVASVVRQRRTLAPRGWAAGDGTARHLTLVPAPELSEDAVRAALDGIAPAGRPPRRTAPRSSTPRRAVLRPERAARAGRRPRRRHLRFDRRRPGGAAVRRRAAGLGGRHPRAARRSGQLAARPARSRRSPACRCSAAACSPAGRADGPATGRDTGRRGRARMPAGRRYTALVPTQLRRYLDTEPDGAARLRRRPRRRRRHRPGAAGPRAGGGRRAS